MFRCIKENVSTGVVKVIDIGPLCDQILKQPFVRSIVFVQIEQDIASFIIDSVDICAIVYKILGYIQLFLFCS